MAMDLRPLLRTAELRRSRYERLARLVNLRPTDRIVDIGCGTGERSIALFNRINPIVGVDLLPPERIALVQANFTYVKADATHLDQFRDQEFDVALSVGLLEHIHPREELIQAVRQHRRVATRYGAVTTHRWAFIEPHYQLPLFAVWPEWAKKAAVITLRPAGKRLRPDGSLRPINWLSAREWLSLFDDPTARALNHWYGPILVNQIIVGGQLRR